MSPTASSSHGGSNHSLPNKLTEQFEIQGEISRGGMGVVYKARDRQLGRDVAIKVITGPKELTDVIRFQREAQVLAQVQHKNIARIWDFGWHEQSPFLVMEFVEGPTLASVVREHLRVQGCCPDPVDIARIMASLADALAVCHAQGIVHRDLKPENIILAKGPSNEDRVVLLDFGVAKRDPTMGPDGRSVMLTETGELLGTPAFMAPEQFSPNSKFGAIGLATDIWGFGATLFFCLTGEYPYPIANGSIGIFEAMMDRGPRRVQSLNLSIPGWLDLLCAACLRRSTDKRPDMKALVWQLRRQLDQEDMKSVSGVSLFDSQWHDRETLPRSPKKYWWLLFFALLLLPPTVMVGIMANNEAPVPPDTNITLRKLRTRLKNTLQARENDLKNGETLNLRKALKLEAKILELEGSEGSTETTELSANLRLLQAEEAYKSGDFNVAKTFLAAAKRRDSKQHSQWLLLSGLVAAEDPNRSDADAIKLLRAGNAEDSAREDVLSTLVELYIREEAFEKALVILQRLDGSSKRYPRYWFQVATKLSNNSDVIRLVSIHGETAQLTPEFELAFLQTVKIFIQREDISSAIKTAKTLFKRKKDSSQRAAIRAELSRWMRSRFGYKNWGDDFFQPKYLRNSILICNYLSAEFGDSVPEKLWITFGDFIVFCIGPAEKFNTYKDLEALGSHLTRWRPNESRSWLIYSEIIKRCIGHLPIERRMAIARSFAQSQKASLNTQERLVLQYRYRIFYRMAGLHKEGLKTIPQSTPTECKEYTELSANAVHEQALTFIDLSNIEKDKRQKWLRKALTSLHKARKISPDLMKRTEILLHIGNIQRELSNNLKAIRTYLMAIDHLEMRIELEHRWSRLLYHFLHAIQDDSKASILHFRQKLSARSKKRTPNCAWMFKRLDLLLKSLEAWSLEKPDEASAALKELKGSLAAKQKTIAEQLIAALAAKTRNNAHIKARYQALAINLHLN